MKDWYPHKNVEVFVPDPTWPLHRNLAELTGFKWKNYRYYDKKAKGFDYKGMLEDLKAAPKNSIFLFHVCAHNPTGCDPS